MAPSDFLQAVMALVWALIDKAMPTVRMRVKKFHAKMNF